MARLVNMHLGQSPISESGVISTSFADIFFNNSFKNGLLLIKVTSDQRDALLEDANRGENARVEIDWKIKGSSAQTVQEISFEVDPFRKHCLLKRLDDIGITLQSEDNIASFEKRQKQAMPWMQGARV